MATFCLLELPSEAFAWEEDVEEVHLPEDVKRAHQALILLGQVYAVDGPEGGDDLVEPGHIRWIHRAGIHPVYPSPVMHPMCM